MHRIIVLGGSVAGLLCAMQAAHAGHDVIVLERETRSAVALPAEAALVPRRGAPHTVQGHALLARAAVEIRRALPAVYAALLIAGVGELDLVAGMPPAIADRARRPGDEELILLTSRRRTLDRVLVEAAEATPHLDLRFGVVAADLLFAHEEGGTPRVAGVRTTSGEELAADVVVDASGRRTAVPRWLEARGIALPLEAWECGLVYFTRHYAVRAGGPRPPLNRVFAAGAALPSALINWFPGDNDTAMLAMTVLAEDTLLKTVARVERFEALARAVPPVTAWLECADPTSGVFAMGAMQNTLRRTVQDGLPLVLGLHLLGDAACTTNPTLGRGISLAATAATHLARLLSEHPDDLVAQAVELDAFTRREVEPRFRENAQFDRALAARLRADLAGQPAPAPPPYAEDRLRPDELQPAGLVDADLYRTAMRYGQLLTETAALADPALVTEIRRRFPPDSPPLPLPGPGRADLSAILAAA